VHGARCSSHQPARLSGARVGVTWLLWGRNYGWAEASASSFESILPKTILIDGLTLEMLLSANTGCPNVPISVAFFLFFLLKISFAVSLNLSVQAVHTCHVIVYQPDLFFAAMSSCASSTKVNAGSIKEYVPTRRSSRLTSSQSMNTNANPIYWTSSGHDHSSGPEHDHATHASTSTSSSNSTTVDKHEYSKALVAAYLNDASSSQILHRHSSAKESVHTHTAAMQSCLDAFDAAIEGSK